MRITVLIPVLLLFACNRSPLQKELSGCDSLVITFNEPGSDSVVKTISTTSKIAIRKMKGFLDSKQTTEFKCGYDGSLIFYSEGKKALPVVFQYRKNECRHFLFELEGKLQSTRLSQEAADMLQSLGEGKNVY